ncbi:MAG: hypothetical protein JWR76_218, partial [Mucilaginibacter sp.]|nr:hypothetical protein [Mucilaginibacter sp.]
MRIFLRVIFTLFLAYPMLSVAGTDSLLNVLKKEIGRKDIYENEKQARIQSLKKLQHKLSKIDYTSQYDVSLKLYD